MRASVIPSVFGVDGAGGQGGGAGGGAALSRLSVTVGDLTFGTGVDPGTTESITITADGSGSFAAGKLVFTGDTDTFRIVTFSGDTEDTPFECSSGDYYFSMGGAGSVTFVFDVVYTDGTAESMPVSVVNLEDGVTDDSLTATAQVDSLLITAIRNNITETGIWFVKSGLAHNHVFSAGDVAMEDLDSAPDIKSSAAFVVKTDDLPTVEFESVIDMSAAFGSQFLAIASALASAGRCGGIIFKVHSLSTAEITLLSQYGTYPAPLDDADGVFQGDVFVSDWVGFGANPPILAGLHSADNGSGGWFTGYGGGSPYTGWLHYQWKPNGSGATNVRGFLSKVGTGAWASLGTLNSTGPGSGTFGTGLQIGHHASHQGTGTVKIACVYYGSNDTLSDAAMQAIHEDGGLT